MSVLYTARIDTAPETIRYLSSHLTLVRFSYTKGFKDVKNVRKGSRDQIGTSDVFIFLFDSVFAFNSILLVELTIHLNLGYGRQAPISSQVFHDSSLLISPCLLFIVDSVNRLANSTTTAYLDSGNDKIVFISLFSSKDECQCIP